MLVSEFAMVVKSLDFISEGHARTLHEAVLEQVCKNVKASRAEIWSAGEDRDGTRLNPIACSGAGCNADDWKGFSVRPETKGVLAWAARTDTSVWLNDVPDQKHNGYVLNLADQEKIGKEFHNFRDDLFATLTVPARFRKRVRGLIRVESGTGGIGFSRSDWEALKSLQEIIAIVLWKVDASNENSDHTRDAVGSFCSALRNLKPKMNPYRTGFIARPFTPEAERLSAKLADIFRRREIRARTYLPSDGARLVVIEMFDQISRAHFGLVDLTALNPNVLTEFGALQGQQKQFLLFRAADDEAEMPFDLAGFQIHRYAFEDDRVVLRDPTGNRTTLDEVVDRFIDTLLAEDEAFKAALPYRG
jgi:GAF domain